MGRTSGPRTFPRGTPQSSRKGTAVHRVEAAIVTKIATRASLCATR